MRQRKQREVAKENEFYMQLLQQALPQEEPTEDSIALTETISVAAMVNNGEVVRNSNGSTRSPPKVLNVVSTAQSNGHAVGASNGSVSSGLTSRGHHGKRNNSTTADSSKCDLNNHSSSKSSIHQTSYHQQQLCGNSSSVSSTSTYNSTASGGGTTNKDVTRSSSDSLSGGSSRERDKDMYPPQNPKTDHHHQQKSSNGCPDANGQSDGSPSSTKSSQINKVQHNSGINYNCNSEQHGDTTTDVSVERGKKRNRTKQKDIHHVNGVEGHVQTNHNQTSQTVPQICESCLRLEAEVKKMRSDVGHMKQVEHDLRQKLDSGATIKSCLQAKQKENDELEKKLVNIVFFICGFNFLMLIIFFSKEFKISIIRGTLTGKIC